MVVIIVLATIQFVLVVDIVQVVDVSVVRILVVTVETAALEETQAEVQEEVQEEVLTGGSGTCSTCNGTRYVTCGTYSIAQTPYKRTGTCLACKASVEESHQSWACTGCGSVSDPVILYTCSCGRKISCSNGGTHTKKCPKCNGG